MQTRGHGGAVSCDEAERIRTTLLRQAMDGAMSRSRLCGDDAPGRRRSRDVHVEEAGDELE